MVTFHPSKLKGSAAIPPAKSEAHRALLLAALGHNPCRLHGFTPPLCDDTLAMIAGIQALGAAVATEGETLFITPAPEPKKDAPPVTCYVKACAAALRMLIPAFLVRGQRVRFTMEEGLFRRPLSAFDALIQQLGGRIERIPAKDGQPCTVVVEGYMPAGEYAIDGSQSSQFASGMLIALSHGRNAQGHPAQSFLTITGNIVSRPYLDMTLKLMKRFNLNFVERDEGVFTLSRRSAPSPEDVRISGDWSQAAVLLCANAMGSGVMVRNLLSDDGECLQGDARIMSILNAMGLRMLSIHQELYAVCPSHAELRPIDVDCTDIPDIAPILALSCARIRGTSTLRGVQRLTIKECDRLTATVELLSQLGVAAQASADGDVLTVTGGAPLKGGFEADARGDHRMVMFLAVAALSADKPITVHGADALNKSWPGFMETYQALGGKIS